MGDRLQVHRTSVTNIIDGLEAQRLRAPRAARARPPRDARGDHRRAAATVAEEATRTLNAERFGTAPLGDEEAQKLFDLLLPMRVEAGDF